ncbi:hypothetical protein MPLB_560038 [Mesorhizobium sp. ORS 3324]|nr:hypothetical protein MPLB_560038 [Mesorhizobium sp. ORS 3324]
MGEQRRWNIAVTIVARLRVHGLGEIAVAAPIAARATIFRNLTVAEMHYKVPAVRVHSTLAGRTVAAPTLVGRVARTPEPPAQSPGY